MSTSPLPSASSTRQPGHRRTLALIVEGISATLAGLAVGYALGTVHAHERRLGAAAHGVNNGV